MTFDIREKLERLHSLGGLEEFAGPALRKGYEAETAIHLAEIVAEFERLTKLVEHHHQAWANALNDRAAADSRVAELEAALQKVRQSCSDEYCVCCREDRKIVRAVLERKP